MPNKIEVQYIGLSDVEVKDAVTPLLAPYHATVEMKVISRPNDSTHQGVILGVIITLVVEPFLKSSVEFVAKEFCSAVMRMVHQWRAKHNGATATILLKKDESDSGTAINPEANEEYFEELWHAYAEDLTKGVGE